MGMAERAGIADRLMAGGRPPATPVAVVHWGTTDRHRWCGHPRRIGRGRPAGARDHRDRPGGRARSGRRPAAGGWRWRPCPTPPRSGAGRAGGWWSPGPGPRPRRWWTVDGSGGGGRRAAGHRHRGRGRRRCRAGRQSTDRGRPVTTMGGLHLGQRGGPASSPRSATGLRRSSGGPRWGRRPRRPWREAWIRRRPGARAAVSEALAEAFPSAGPGRPGDRGRPRCSTFPRAETVAGVLVAGLEAKGWEVDEVVAYRTAAGQPGPRGRWPPPGADAVAFTSSSTVERTVALLGVDGVPPVVVSIGPVTSAPERGAGFHGGRRGDRHTIEGLVDASGGAPGVPPPSDRSGPPSRPRRVGPGCRRLGPCP